MPEMISSSTTLGIAIVTMIGSILAPLAAGLVAVFVKSLDNNQKNREVEHQIQLKKVELRVERVRKRLESGSEATGKKVDEVKEALKQTTEAHASQALEQSKQIKEIHTLVNSRLGQSLKISAEALRSVADSSGRSDHAEAALQAEALYQEHMEAQAAVDAEKSKTLPSV